MASTSTPTNTPARNTNGARIPNASADDRGDERSEHEAGDVEGGEASEVRCRRASGSRVITMRRMAGPTAPLPSPSSSRATTNAQNSVATALPNMAPIASTIPPRTSNGM